MASDFQMKAMNKVHRLCLLGDGEGQVGFGLVVVAVGGGAV
jgi:hypothetical protein